MLPQAPRPQMGWNQKVDDTDSHLPHHQPIRRTSTSLSHPLYYKTPHCLLQVRTHSFEGINPLWSPLPGKAIKLFFSTSPKTLSLRINSVSGYRSHTQLYQDPQNPNFQETKPISPHHARKPLASWLHLLFHQQKSNRQKQELDDLKLRNQPSTT